MPWYAMSGGQHTPYTTYFQDTCACDVTHDQSRSSGPVLLPKTISLGKLVSSHTPSVGHTCANQADLKLIEVHLALPPPYWDQRREPSRPLALGFPY